MFYRDLGFRLTKAQSDRVVENLNLARREAWRFHKRCEGKLDYSDLEAVAFVGLMKACNKFDESLGWKLSTYAVPKIRGELLHYVRDHSYLLRLSHRMRDVWCKGKRLLDQGMNDLQVAAKLEIDLAEWLDTRKACSGAPLELKDSVADKRQLEPKEDDRLTALEKSVDDAWAQLAPSQKKNLLANFRFDHLLKDGVAELLVKLTEAFYAKRGSVKIQHDDLKSASVSVGRDGVVVVTT